MGRKEDNVQRAQALFNELGQIRNIGTAAHIDHGKSTLADRMIQRCGGLSEREMKEQVLDTRPHGFQQRRRPAPEKDYRRRARRQDNNLASIAVV